MRKEEVLQMAATIAAGILSNPVMGSVVLDGWERQQLIQTVIQDTFNIVQNTGIIIKESSND